MANLGFKAKGIRGSGSLIGGGKGVATQSGAIDADAQAFIDAAGITDGTEIAAVNQLVLDLKGEGSTTNNTDCWSNFEFLYPFSPTSLDAASYNLIDPASFQLTYFNSPTHSSTGVDFSTSKHADTGFIPNTHAQYMTATQGSVGARGTKTSVVVTNYYGGSLESTIRRLLHGYIGTADIRCWIYRTGTGFQLGYTTSVAERTQLQHVTAQNATSRKFYADDVLKDTTTSNDTQSQLPQVSQFVGGYNDGSSAAGFYNGVIQFYYQGGAMTDNQMQDISDAESKYQTALSRI